MLVKLYHAWEVFGREIIGKFGVKFFLTNIHRYIENVFGICTDCSLFAKLFLTNSFYLYGSPKYSPAKYFMCTVV